MKITMAHGSGGKATGELIQDIFAKQFDNPVLQQMEDAAAVAGAPRIAITTDSFVVEPLEFPGGDIGRLCICGTVNDLLMRGAVPKYLTCGFILQEGADTAQIQKYAMSMAETAKEAGVTLVAGDTKVVEGNGGLFINTAGVGFLQENLEIASSQCKPGDVILVSGNMGDHHATILSQRMGIQNSIKSDCAPLNEMVSSLLQNHIQVHALRDVTRGGLATVLKELAEASQTTFCLEEALLPVSAQVRDFCGLMGLDPLYMGNEGKMVAVVAEEDSKKALELIKNSKYGENACEIGRVTSEDKGILYVETSIGGKRIMDVLQGEGLPRIC